MIRILQQVLRYAQDNNIVRADKIENLPLTIPNNNARGRKASMNQPLINLFYTYPSPRFIPYKTPVTPLPIVSAVDLPSMVIQDGQVNRLSANATRQYLQSKHGATR